MAVTAVGKFVYAPTGTSVHLDDRTLTHVRVAMLIKLHRSESFMFSADVGEGNGRRHSFWISPPVPVQFHFYTPRRHALNNAWVQALVVSAGSTNGLIITDEPPAGQHRKDTDG